MRRMPLVFLTLLAAAATVLAQPGPHVVKMTLHPVGPSTPAMKYALLPEVRDLRPGNAAIFYYRSHSPEWEQVLNRHPDRGHFHEWLDLPLKQAPVEKVMVATNMLKELDIGARTDHCDWQMLTRLREENLTMLVPDIQAFLDERLAGCTSRPAGNAQRQARSSRLHVSDRPGHEQARRRGALPHRLSSRGGHCFCDARSRRGIHPAAGRPQPVLVLTDLPRPLIALRRPLQGERMMIDGLFPEIRHVLNDPGAGPIPVPRIVAQVEKLSVLGRAASNPSSGP